MTFKLVYCVVFCKTPIEREELFSMTKSKYVLMKKCSQYIYIYIYSCTHRHTHTHMHVCICICVRDIFPWCKQKLATIVEGNPKAPFSIATIPRCRGGRYSFLGLLYFTLDPYLIMLSVKQGGIKYHFLRLWYDSTWD